ncbi:MAG: AAA family ATPase [Acidimicrobiia bacterium]
MTKNPCSGTVPGTRSRILVVEPEPQLADRIRAAAATLEPVPEIVHRPRLRSSDLASMSGFQVLVVGPSLLDRAGFHRLATLARKAPSTAVVLVVDRRPEATLREIVQVAAVDALPLAISDDELGVALERVVNLGRLRSGNSTAGSSASAPRGQVITVASPTEGCGKTFVAANTALFLARTGARVVLVDLDLQFGEVRTALRARADFSIVDALSSEADGQDLEGILPELLVPLPCGFSVLAAPKDPAEADSVGPADVSRVIDALRAQADYVVVDTPTGLVEHVLPVLDVTDQLLAVGTQDRPSVHNLGVFLRTLERFGLGPEVALVINKADGENDPAEVAALPGCLRTVLPYDREVARSINHGVPILDAAPTAPAARRLLAFLERLVPAPLPLTTPSPPAPPKAGRRVFGGRSGDDATIDPTVEAAGATAPGEDWTEAPLAAFDPPEAGDEHGSLPQPPRPSSGATPARTGRRRVNDGTWPPPERRRRPSTVGPTRTGPHRDRPAARRGPRTRAPPRRGRSALGSSQSGRSVDHSTCAFERGAWRHRDRPPCCLHPLSVSD